MVPVLAVLGSGTTPQKSRKALLRKGLRWFQQVVPDMAPEPLPEPPR